METPKQPDAAAAAGPAGATGPTAAASATAPTTGTAPASASATTTAATTTNSADASGKKISQTCVTCRARKVRCDGRRSICSNCERLGFPCAFDDAEVVAAVQPESSSATTSTAPTASAPAATTSAADILSIPRRRARQACQNCHSRKARCTGGTPQCDRCRTLGIECVYRPGKRTRLSPVLSGSVAGDRDHQQAQPSSAAAAAAAQSLQQFERGLSESSEHMDDGMLVPGSGGQQQTGPLTKVAHLGGTRPGGGHPPPDSGAGIGAGAGGLFPTRSCPPEVLEALAMRTFDQFFRHIHHIPTFAFLHRASLMQRYRAGLVDRPLLLALVGITSLMTDLGPGTRELGKQCIAEAEALVLSRLDRPSTLGLQTLVFVIHHRVLSGRFSSAFMLHGVASRFASALRLNHENTRLCFLARESRRRLMWALYMIDSSMANGYADFSLWAYRADRADAHADVMNIQLPCNERNFEFDLPERTEPLRPPPRGPDGSLPPLPDDIGFLALHVRIRSLRGRILQYTKDVTSPLGGNSSSSASDGMGMDVEMATSSSAMLDTAIDPTAAAIDVASIPGRVAEIAAELDSFAARLPVSFRWSEANVRLRTYSPRLCVFLMTHVWWEQCHCELYRLALVGLQEALPAPYIAQLTRQFPTFVHHCRAQVLEHASAMAEMFRCVLTLENGVPVTDLDLPICLYQCVRLLFYISRTNPDDPQAVPHDSFLELAGVCTQVLERTVTTPATIRIRANLQKLMAHGLSTAAEIGAPSGRSTPEVVHMETEDDMSTMLQQGRVNNATANGNATSNGNGNGVAAAPSPLIPGLSQRAAASAGPPPYAQQHHQQHQQHPQQQPLPHPHQLPSHQTLPDLPNTPVLFDTSFDTQMTSVPPLPQHQQAIVGAPTTATGVSSAGSPQPPSLAAGGAPLDAFDLDVDNFGATDLGGWFSGDWVTNNEFST
ncbi:hypothetical protein SBRCBS47491_005839 [Sporothrix bragantina]|uniref:Zn(2)-C6 fungal-type domain-containing protein n=1 Tax=Sporothrix bragantina TaxID=671064 RepID=A0ABP0C019_9PEZI